MKPAFRRLEPSLDAIVIQSCSARANALDILCAECGWEGHVEPREHPAAVFAGHACRLVTESASTCG